VGRLSGSLAAFGRIGAVRFNAWIWNFESIEGPAALSGGFRYRPTTSRTLAFTSGSVENLNVSRRRG